MNVLRERLQIYGPLIQVKLFASQCNAECLIKITLINDTTSCEAANCLWMRTGTVHMRTSRVRNRHHAIRWRDTRWSQNNWPFQNWSLNNKDMSDFRNFRNYRPVFWTDTRVRCWWRKIITDQADPRSLWKSVKVFLALVHSTATRICGFGHSALRSLITRLLYSVPYRSVLGLLLFI